VDLLIEAFAQLQPTLPTVRLLLVGGGEDFDGLSQRVKALGLTSSVIFTGRIDPNLIWAYYRLSDVTVDPVYNNLAARGRSPLKMFEAWACGVPFVTSPVGDRAALAGDPPAALLVPAGDARALAEGLENVLLHTDQQKTLILRGNERLQEFTWKRLVERVSCFISESPNGNL
jgi:glycosyltransferase involved in cell wall biosynthesis